MEEVAVTWVRGLKLWWSFAWRGMVLMLLLIIPLQIIMFLIVVPSMPKPVAGQAPNIAQMQHTAAIFAILWPIVMVAMIALQVQGMRWMLKKARWSDFRILLVRRQ